MKYFLYFLFVVLLVGCNNNKKVYWCGDHACVNKSEKEAFFKKTMIVEVRNISKNNKDKKLSNIELIKKEFSIEDESKVNEKKLSKLPQNKELSKSEKRRIAKNIKLEKKRKIKEEKIIAKRKYKEEKERLKKAKALAKKSKKKDSKKVTFGSNGLTIDSVTFKKLVEKVKTQNVNKPYPDINIKN